MSTYKLEVQPIEKIRTISSVEIFLQYVFNATDATIYVYFKDTDNSTVDIKQVYIPPEVYAQWTDTDEYLIDYVLKELGLQKI